MKKTIVSILALSASLCAQTSSTLPKDFDNTAGTQRLWAGWDVADPARGGQQTPGRGICIYDATTFPWSTVTPIRTLSVRRNNADPNTTTTAHTKTMRLFMSTDGPPPTNPDMGSWTRNHGSDLKMIFGTVAAPKTVNFPATGTSNGAAPFNVSFPLDSPFVVRGTEKSVTIEWRSYAATPTTSVRFLVDATVWTGLTRSNGRHTNLTGTDCSGVKLSTGGARTWIGGSVRMRVTSTASRPNLPFVGLLGAKLGAVVKLPNTNCELWTLGELLTVPGQVGTAGAIDHVFAPIPLEQSLVGVKVTAQAAFFDTTFPPLNIGLSTAREIEIGAGADTSGQLHGYHLYSYGTSHSGHDNKPMDPDTNKFPPRAVQDRAVIWKIN